MSIGAFGENFPYTNFHDLNLDWIIAQLRKVQDGQEAAEIAIEARNEAIGAKNDAVQAKEDTEEIEAQAQVILDTIREIQNTLKVNRLWGKTLAIYGDSYSANPRGILWQTVLNALTGTTCHVSAQGSLSLPQIYDLKWDEYNADIYIIEAGLNDVTRNTTAKTFIDTIQSFVNSIRTINANAEIYFVTPPDIPDTIMHNYIYPTEFYRQCYWHLMSRYRYGVIDGLKWQGLRYSDNVHASNDTAPLIGKYIFESLSHYGDAINFCNDYSKIGRDNVQLLLIMENGTPYLYPQDLEFSELFSDGSAELSLSTMGMAVTPQRVNFTYKVGTDYINGFAVAIGTSQNTRLEVAFEGLTTGNTGVLKTGFQIPIIPDIWTKGF